MFDVFSNIPHYDLMAWTFWICFGLVFISFLQFGLLMAVYLDLKKRLMTLQYLGPFEEEDEEDDDKGKKKKKSKKDKKSKKQKKGKKSGKGDKSEKSDKLPDMFF